LERSPFKWHLSLGLGKKTIVSWSWKLAHYKCSSRYEFNFPSGSKN
jgi:hypothetical protein